MKFSFSAVFGVFLMLLNTVSALKFTLEALPDRGNTRCIREFAGKEILVVVKAEVSGTIGDGQRLSMNIKDSKGNTYAFKDDINNKAYNTFSPTQDTSFDVCFTNTLTNGRQGGTRSRDIEVEIEVGVAARDWNAIQAAERLKPAELDLRRLTEMAEEIKDKFDYLRAREERLRDTNESTNRRCKNFFILVMVSFLALGAWQIQYLRAYFRSKHII